MKLFFIRPGTQAWNFTKKDISCEVCKMFQNNLFTETLKSIVSDDFWFENVFCRGKEAIAGKFSVKKVYFKLLQNSHEKQLCWSLFSWIKLQVSGNLRPTTLLKKRLQHSCFSVNFINLVLQNTCGGLLWGYICGPVRHLG